MDNIGHVIASILTAIIGVAILAVLVGQNSQTSGVVTAFANGFSSILKVAVSPVTSTSTGFN